MHFAIVCKCYIWYKISLFCYQLSKSGWMSGLIKYQQFERMVGLLGDPGIRRFESNVENKETLHGYTIFDIRKTWSICNTWGFTFGFICTIPLLAGLSVVWVHAKLAIEMYILRQSYVVTKCSRGMDIWTPSWPTYVQTRITSKRHP